MGARVRHIHHELQVICTIGHDITERNWTARWRQCERTVEIQFSDVIVGGIRLRPISISVGQTSPIRRLEATGSRHDCVAVDGDGFRRLVLDEHFVIADYEYDVIVWPREIDKTADDVSPGDMVFKENVLIAFAKGAGFVRVNVAKIHAGAGADFSRTVKTDLSNVGVAPVASPLGFSKGFPIGVVENTTARADTVPINR